MMSYPTPHGDKLRALLGNPKLPSIDYPRVHSAVEHYEEWVGQIAGTLGKGECLVEPLVELLNSYKKTIDLDLVFDSEADFLYRQKGQLKIDNTILEEFLPWLVGRIHSDSLAGHEISFGPTNAFSQLRFDSNLTDGRPAGGMTIRSKDHDFALARPLFFKASHYEDFREASEERANLAYLAAEIKTNLDKTMFQEASATASDLKIALPNSRYLLLCEWLDMTPISTAVTAIEEVIVLRKARRLGADVRRRFATSSGRASYREAFIEQLEENPFTSDAFHRFLGHIRPLLGHGETSEQDVLERGWF